jgi:hypothetical protein
VLIRFFPAIPSSDKNPAKSSSTAAGIERAPWSDRAVKSAQRQNNAIAPRLDRRINRRRYASAPTHVLFAVIMMDFRTGAHPAASTAMEIPINRLEISFNRLKKQGKRVVDRLSDTRIEAEGHFRALSSTH